jgi:predicted lipoprotein with Yx(FWY)xxD motif
VIHNQSTPGRRVAALVACLVVAGYASMGVAQSPAKAASDGTLTNAAGMTLYTFDRDADGKSACNGPCATNWPRVAATGDAKTMGDWSVVTREDGSKQWAYKGKPLYAWSKDTKPGDKTGDGLNSVWHTAKQ